MIRRGFAATSTGTTATRRRTWRRRRRSRLGNALSAA